THCPCVPPPVGPDSLSLEPNPVVDEPSSTTVAVQLLNLLAGGIESEPVRLHREPRTWLELPAHQNGTSTTFNTAFARFAADRHPYNRIHTCWPTPQSRPASKHRPPLRG